VSGESSPPPPGVVASFLIWSVIGSLEYVWPDTTSEEVRMQSRRQGSLQVSALGCLGICEFYGDGYERQSIAAIAGALDLCGPMLETANMYGPFTHEQLVGSAAPAHGGARGAT
jgi:hypothetical protein